ncbi:MAG: ion channel [Syntrophobacterales bacterium]|jgi:hypothetical protein
MPDQLHFPFLRFRIGRFLFLLIFIVLMFILRPFLESFIGIKLLMDIFFSFILISGAYAVSHKRATFIVGLILVIPALATTWSNLFADTPFSVKVGGQILEGLFFAYTSIVIVYYLFREKKVTFEVISGAICGYLLIGLTWAFVYSVLESFNAGSFQLPEGQGTTISHFAYYSFVTLTTLGYGDITPLSGPARSLALLEAITGQLYIAIMIAGLVGVYISQSIEKELE